MYKKCAKSCEASKIEKKMPPIVKKRGEEDFCNLGYQNTKKRSFLQTIQTFVSKKLKWSIFRKNKNLVSPSHHISGIESKIGSLRNKPKIDGTFILYDNNPGDLNPEQDEPHYSCIPPTQKNETIVDVDIETNKVGYTTKLPSNMNSAPFVTVETTVDLDHQANNTDYVDELPAYMSITPFCTNLTSLTNQANDAVYMSLFPAYMHTTPLQKEEIPLDLDFGADNLPSHSNTLPFYKDETPPELTNRPNDTPLDTDKAPVYDAPSYSCKDETQLNLDNNANGGSSHMSRFPVYDAYNCENTLDCESSIDNAPDYKSMPANYLSTEHAVNKAGAATIFLSEDCNKKEKTVLQPKINYDCNNKNVKTNNILSYLKIENKNHPKKTNMCNDFSDKFTCNNEDFRIRKETQFCYSKNESELRKYLYEIDKRTLERIEEENRMKLYQNKTKQNYQNIVNESVCSILGVNQNEPYTSKLKIDGDDFLASKDAEKECNKESDKINLKKRLNFFKTKEYENPSFETFLDHQNETSFRYYCDLPYYQPQQKEKIDKKRYLKVPKNIYDHKKGRKVINHDFTAHLEEINHIRSDFVKKRRIKKRNSLHTNLYIRGQNISTKKMLVLKEIRIEKK